MASHEDSTMTQAHVNASCARPRKDRLSRLLAATCTASFLAVAALSATGHVQPVAAQASAPLDTSKLPRPAAIKQLVALPQTTIILSALPVPNATRSALGLLEADGWQPYLTPGSQIVQQPTSETHQLKKGSQALILFVQTTPAQNNATSISYTELPLDRDLPFPDKATDIRFSPSPLHLDATVPLAHEALLAFYRAQLTAAGWTLHSASDGSAPKQISTGEGMQHAFFTHVAHGALHVTAKAVDRDSATIAIRSVPASILPGAQVARAPAPAAAQPNPNTDAHAQMSRQMDSMVQDLMKQALQPPPKSAGVDAALAAARNSGVRIDMPGKAPSSVATSAAPVSDALNAQQLERDEFGGLPIPKGSSSKSQERTNFRVEVGATVKGSTPDVLAFYRRELSALGWRESLPAKTEAERTVVNFISPEGPAVLTLSRKGREQSISLLLRKEAEARKSGLMPKDGQGKIVLGSMLDGDATVLIGGRSIKVLAGTGSKEPNGPSLEVAPGSHKVTIKSAGKPDVVEVVTVRADDIWGVLLGPGGALPLQIY
jgi:hypothetical protein